MIAFLLHLVCLLILYNNRTYYDSVQEDGPDVVKESLVVEGVCRLQDDGGQQEVEEELGSELEEEVVEVPILDNRRPQHADNNQQTAGLLTIKLTSYCLRSRPVDHHVVS